MLVKEKQNLAKSSKIQLKIAKKQEFKKYYCKNSEVKNSNVIENYQ